MSRDVQVHLAKLGKKIRDRVTKVEGVLTSVCFDLYGCIQGALDRGYDKEGKRHDSLWMDMSRFEVLDEKPVMAQPDFVSGPVARGEQGAADKPAPP